jgi:hypothetical protein
MSLNPPQDYRKTEFTHRSGLSSDRPAASDVLVGTLYFSTDTLALERSNGTTWDTFSVPSPISASTLLGREDTSAGAVQEITLSKSFIMTGTELTIRTGIFDYTYNSSTAEPPSAGQIRMDNIFPFVTTTKVWMRFVSADGQDLFWGIMITPTGSSIIIQDQDDHTRFVRLTTTGVPIDKGLYAEIPVTYVSSGVAIVSAQKVFIRSMAS